MKKMANIGMDRRKNVNGQMERHTDGQIGIHTNRHIERYTDGQMIGKVFMLLRTSKAWICEYKAPRL